MIWSAKGAEMHFKHFSMHSYLFAISLDAIPVVTNLSSIPFENNGTRLQPFPFCVCVCVAASASSHLQTSNISATVACARLTSQIFGWIHKLASQNEIFLWENFTIYHRIFASHSLCRLYFPPFTIGRVGLGLCTNTSDWPEDEMHFIRCSAIKWNTENRQ